MFRFVVKRLLWMIPVVLGVTILLFTLMYFVPGDPVQIILGAGATPEQIANLRAKFGLDQPFLIRLGNYLKNVFMHFDLGVSYTTDTSISAALFERLPRTFTLALGCMFLALVIGVPLGITAAVYQNGLMDRICMFLALIGVAMPGFWLALMLVIVFALKLGWLPPIGIGGIQYYILPVISNCMAGIATQARQTRSSMLEVIRSDYITTARAKGTAELTVLYKHALPNALIPVIALAGSSFGHMLGGTLVIETVFSIPGIGTYVMAAVNNRDYPAIQGSVIFLAITFSLCMLLVDVLFAFADPRIKAQYEGQHKKKGHEK
jgi:peptide/nickel transport system permease protein